MKAIDKKAVISRTRQTSSDLPSFNYLIVYKKGISPVSQICLLYAWRQQTKKLSYIEQEKLSQIYLLLITFIDIKIAFFLLAKFNSSFAWRQQTKKLSYLEQEKLSQIYLILITFNVIKIAFFLLAKFNSLYAWKQQTKSCHISNKTIFLRSTLF